MKRAITKAETEKTIRLRVPSSTFKNKKLNEMKTKNNVQKTVLRTGAVVASFVLISFTVAAQDFWKTLLTNSSFNQIALAMVENSKKSDVKAAESNNKVANYIYENEYDSNLVIEDWMTNNVYFNTAIQPKVEKVCILPAEKGGASNELYTNTNETESPLTLENWMTDNRVWMNRKFSKNSEERK